MSLRRLATRPELPDLRRADHLPELPRATLVWILEEETTAFLHQLCASLMDRHGCGAWQSMVILCRLARGAWAAGIPARAPRREVVLDRDDWRCAVPGCSRRRGLQKHHVHMLSHGGGDEIENLITLCAFHHQIGVHQGLLQVRGRATRGGEDLTFVLGLRPGRRPLQVFRGEHRRPRSSVPLPAGKAWSMV